MIKKEILSEEINEFINTPDLVKQFPEIFRFLSFMESMVDLIARFKGNE